MARNANQVNVDATEKAAPVKAEKAAPKAVDTISKMNTEAYGAETSIAFNFNNYGDLAAIDNGIETLRSSGETNKQRAHELAVATIRHYVAHGDYTRLVSLLVAVRFGISKSYESLLKDYIQKNVPTLRVQLNEKVDGKERGVVITHLKGAARRFIAEEKKALNVAFWTGEKEVNVFAFNFNSELVKLLDRAFSAESTVASFKGKTVLKNEDGTAKRKLGKVEMPSIDDLKALAEKYGVTAMLKVNQPKA